MTSLLMKLEQCRLKKALNVKKKSWKRFNRLRRTCFSLYFRLVQIHNGVKTAPLFLCRNCQVQLGQFVYLWLIVMIWILVMECSEIKDRCK